MSVQENKKEENEDTILDHVSDDHPLSLTTCSEAQPCRVCDRYILSGEMAYTCHKCPWSAPLHEECAEMPREIRLSTHDPRHTLIQKKKEFFEVCPACEFPILEIGYSCTNSSCGFDIHVQCVSNIGLSKTCIDHPGHPHQLTLQRRPGRSCSSRCDACGTIHKGSPYVCSDCQFWILESCANLPEDADYPHLHHHPLSLAYSLPTKYIRFRFSCQICFQGFLSKYWVYHCRICRFVVHINCAITTKNIHLDDRDEAADKNVVVFPIQNTGEELIGPFVKKVIGAKVLPHNNEIDISKYKFHNRDHQLHLIPFSLHNQEEEEDRDIGDDELNCRRRSELICNGCTTPIFEKKQNSEDKYYMSCGECKYFLHWACFNLPPELPSHPLHRKPGQTLILRSPPEFDLTLCRFCGIKTNGLFYGCTECAFKIDIKCASLPDTIKHAAHPNHHLKLLDSERDLTIFSWKSSSCVACGMSTIFSVGYKCEICQIFMHASCALLPTTVSNPTWDRHPFPLTFDAGIDHPSDFYCDICEEEMNPKWWMYHCRTCDFSFHPNCFRAASNKYRNVVFGQRYDVGSVHHHPLVYQLLTSKLHCDVCRDRKEYGCPGFQCASHECDFFMCFDPCGEKHIDTFRVVPQFRLTL